MGLLARTPKQIVCYRQARGRADQPNAVAGGINQAILDHGIMPVPPGNRIVPGIKLAAYNTDVRAPSVRRAAPVNAIPSTDNFHISDLHIVGDLHEYSVVRGIDNRDIAQRKAPAIGQANRMRSAHSFFARWIEDFVAVND